jgi:hypothetical protein
MHTSSISFRSSALVALLAALGLGCAPADGDAPPAASEEDFTARPGYWPIRNERGGVYVSVAVADGRAFLGDNRRGIDVVDLATMKKTGTLDGRIPADSLSASGELLAACGDRDDRPLSWESLTKGPDRSYVITLLDPRSGEIEREITLRLQPHLDTLNEALIDRPSLSCALDASSNTITISFSHRKLDDEIVTFQVPEESARYDFRDIPGATRTKVTGAGPNTIKAFSVSERGVTYAAGGYGIRRIARGAQDAAFTTVRDEGREHMVGVVERGDRLFAADHDGALRVLDAGSGAQVEVVPVEDWVEGVTIAGDSVLVVARGGLLVARNRWTR